MHNRLDTGTGGVIVPAMSNDHLYLTKCEDGVIHVFTAEPALGVSAAAVCGATHTAQSAGDDEDYVCSQCAVELCAIFGQDAREMFPELFDNEGN